MLTWIMAHMWWIIGGALLFGGIGVDQLVRVARQRHAEATRLGDDLDATLAPLPPLPAPHLVGCDEDAGTGLAAGSPAVPAGGAVPDTGAALFYGRTADRLTGVQRRRAQRKGRLPRVVPAEVVALLADDAPGEITGPFSITDLGGGGVPAPAAAEHHLPGGGGPDHSEVRGTVAGEPRPVMLTVYDPWFRQPRPVFPTLYESVAWQARHDATWAELAAMRDDAYKWLEAAA